MHYRVSLPVRIALIHAVTVAMAPVHEAFARLWPAAECADLLDTALSVDRERDGELTPAMAPRTTGSWPKRRRVSPATTRCCSPISQLRAPRLRCAPPSPAQS